MSGPHQIANPLMFAYEREGLFLGPIQLYLYVKSVLL